jgi:hypothetical protein
MSGAHSAKRTQSEEARAVDEIIHQEQEECNQSHSSDGLCPCCGTELERFYETEIAYFDECPYCQWESDLYYDA